jgi:chromosome segregation ATPase
MKDYFDSNGKIIVKKGEPYYWWKFKNRDRQISKFKPSADKLKKYGPTEFETNWADYEGRKDEAEYDEDEREQLKSDIEEYKGELEDKIQNMPEQLQESSVLNEYVEQLDELLGELNDMD